MRGNPVALCVLGADALTLSLCRIPDKEIMKWNWFGGYSFPAAPIKLWPGIPDLRARPCPDPAGSFARRPEFRFGTVDRTEAREIVSGCAEKMWRAESASGQTFALKSVTHIRTRWAMSPSFSLTDVLLARIERPSCARCRTRMMLVTIEPRQNGTEKRTFECSKCCFIETEITAGRERSDAIIRPAARTRSPD